MADLGSLPIKGGSEPGKEPGVEGTEPGCKPKGRWFILQPRARPKPPCPHDCFFLVLLTRNKKDGAGDDLGVHCVTSLPSREKSEILRGGASGLRSQLPAKWSQEPTSMWKCSPGSVGDDDRSRHLFHFPSSLWYLKEHGTTSQTQRY